MLVLPSNRDGLCLSPWKPFLVSHMLTAPNPHQDAGRVASSVGITTDGYTYRYAVDMRAPHTVTGRVALSMSITGDVSLRRPSPPPSGPLRDQYLLALADVMSAE